MHIGFYASMHRLVLIKRTTFNKLTRRHENHYFKQIASLPFHVDKIEPATKLESKGTYKHRNKSLFDPNSVLKSIGWFPSP